jgi:predicted component of type VI protein secretion system
VYRWINELSDAQFDTFVKEQKSLRILKAVYGPAIRKQLETDLDMLKPQETI